MSDDILNDVNRIIKLGVGDLNRLDHIKQTLENNKQLYNSDRTYVNDLVKKYLLPTNQNIVDNTTSLKNEKTLKIIKQNGMGLGKKILIAFGIVMIFFVVMITIPLSPNPSNNSETNSYNIGDLIQLEGINIKVINTSTSSTDFWNTPDGTFFHVYVTIENIGKTTTTFTPKQFILIDEQGREFSNTYFFTNSDDAIWTSKEIQPNLPITKFVTFDVPFDPDLRYELKVINAGFVCIKNC